MVDDGTMGELREKNSVQSKFVAISEFGGISRGGIAGYNCSFKSSRF